MGCHSKPLRRWSRPSVVDRGQVVIKTTVICRTIALEKKPSQTGRETDSRARPPLDLAGLKPQRWHIHMIDEAKGSNCEGKSSSTCRQTLQNLAPPYRTDDDNLHTWTIVVAADGNARARITRQRDVATTINDTSLEMTFSTTTVEKPKWRTTNLYLKSVIPDGGNYISVW